MIEPSFEISNPIIAVASAAFAAASAWVATKLTASDAKKRAEQVAAELTEHRIYSAQQYADAKEVNAKFALLDSKIDRRMDGIEAKIDRLIDKFVHPASRHE